jgi:hypothetical protein
MAPGTATFPRKADDEERQLAVKLRVALGMYFRLVRLLGLVAFRHQAAIRPVARFGFSPPRTAPSRPSVPIRER